MTNERVGIRNAAKEYAQAERAKRLAEMVQEKTDAMDGVDVQRAKAWEYSIEDNDAWEKKLRKDRATADFRFHDYDQIARRSYKRDVAQMKVDLKAYSAQKEAALGLAPGTLTNDKDLQIVLAQDSSGANSGALASNSLSYASHKPSDDDIDRVMSKINQRYAKVITIMTREFILF